MPNHLVRNPVTNWTNGSTVLRTELQNLDQQLQGCINGDDGGAYMPSVQITFSVGGGLSLSILQSSSFTVTRGGTMTSGNAGAFQCLDGDFPQFATGHSWRTRKVVTPCAGARGIPSWFWTVRRDNAGLQALASMYDLSDGQGFRPATALLPIRAHDGSTIGKVTVSFRVNVPHASLPQTMPSLRMLRMDKSGNTVPLTSVASGADSSGRVFVTKPSSPTAWYNNGAVQSFVLTCDQNNVVDVSQYSYFLEIVEEQGLVGYPWQLVVKQKVRVATVGTLSIAQILGGSTVDGVTLSDGDRVLVKDNLTGANGIYAFRTNSTVQSPSPRAGDLRVSGDFSQGMLVIVDQGAVNGGAVFQATPSLTAWLPAGTPFGAYDWKASTATAQNGFVVPTAPNSTGLYYQATTGGTTGTSEPVWPTVIGQTVTDNTVTWTCQGKGSNNIGFVTRANTLNPTEGTALIGHGVVWHAALVEFDNIADTRWQ